MLSRANSTDLPLAPATQSDRMSQHLASRKIWLPKMLYDALPWFYMGSGILALIGTIYINTWFWVLPHYFLFSLACLHLSIVIFRKRWSRRHELEQSGNESSPDQTA